MNTRHKVVLNVKNKLKPYTTHKKYQWDAMVKVQQLKF